MVSLLVPGRSSHGLLLRIIGTVAGSWTDLGMVAAGVRPLLVDGAVTAFRIKIEAVAVGHPAQGEHAGLHGKMLDYLHLFKSSGYKLRIFFQFKGIHQAHSDQVRGPNLHRQAATACLTALAEAAAEFYPG